MAEDDLYRLLNTDRHATDDEIKSSYHQLARQMHPDRNPAAEEKFKEITQAYNILSDKKNRHIYNQLGLDGVRENAHEPTVGDRLMYAGVGGYYFGKGTFAGRPLRRYKPDDSIVNLKVTLQDLYNGRTTRVPVEHKLDCNNCGGRGVMNGLRIKCQYCNGKGLVEVMSEGDDKRMLKSRCADCKGMGESIDEQYICRICDGRGIQSECKFVEVEIKRGMKSDTKLYFPGQGESVPGYPPADVVVLFSMIYHDEFARIENNLEIEYDITLRDSLCGFTRIIEHLDGRKLIIRHEPGKIMKHKEMRVIKGEGMPFLDDPDKKGDMIIKFMVKFPEEGFASLEDLEKLGKLLPGGPELEMPPADKAVETTLEVYVKPRRQRDPYDSRDEGSDSSENQCATQ